MVPIKEVLVRDQRYPSFVTGGRSVNTTRPTLLVATPELELYCENDECLRNQRFASDDRRSEDDLLAGGVTLLYRCKNCGDGWKTLAVTARPDQNQDLLDAVKLGEWPVYGPKTVPPDLNRIMQSPHVRLYYKGLSCEGQGLAAR